MERFNYAHLKRQIFDLEFLERGNFQKDRRSRKGKFPKIQPIFELNSKR